MEFRQLRYFLKIVEMGSFSSAARVLHISQPSLSYQLTQLEAELGVKVLLRNSNGVKLTAEGVILHAEAKKIVGEIGQIKHKINNSSEALKGKVSIAMAPTQAAQYALLLIKKVRDLYPLIYLDIFEGTSNDSLKSVFSGHRDLSVIIGDDSVNLANCHFIFDEELFLISRADMAPVDSSVDKEFLKVIPLILPSADQMPKNFYESKLGLKINQSDNCINKNIIISNSVSIYRQAVFSGLSHAIQPWGAVLDDIISGRIKATSFDPPIFRKVGIFYSAEASLSQAAMAVKDIFISIVCECHEKGFVKGSLLFHR